MVGIWYIFAKLGSIAENLAELGALIPKFLVKAIEKIKDKADQDKIQKNN